MSSENSNIMDTIEPLKIMYSDVQAFMIGFIFMSNF